MSFVMFSFPGSLRVSHDFDDMFEDLFQNAFNPPLFDLEDTLFEPASAYASFLSAEPVYTRNFLPIYDAGAELFQRLFSVFQNDPLERFFSSEYEDMPLLVDSEAMSDYTAITQHNNTVRHQNALAQNQDGAAYFKIVIEKHVATLSQADKVKFKEMMESCDPDIFVKLPELVVKAAITSPHTLTASNLPNFLHPHIDALEKMRQKKLQGDALKNEIGRIATELHRDTNCIASMQKAIQP